MPAREFSLSPGHTPVLLAEVLQWLQPQPGQTIVDGTLGQGGHTRALADCVGPDGQVLSFDLDPAALTAAEAVLKGLPIKLVTANFCELGEVLAQLSIPAVDGLLLDLGLSSNQLADASRGFSFDADGPLDLRFNPAAHPSAAELVNRLGAEELANLIFRYGEERYSRRIARRIVERRQQNPLATAQELAELVRACVPRSPRERTDPATRTFQALRIAVNDELGSLERILRDAPELLRPGGRMAVISFHSLEDRLVKRAFADDPRFENLTRKPLVAAEAEVACNPRARSAKLRVATRRVTPLPNYPLR